MPNLALLAAIVLASMCNVAVAADPGEKGNAADGRRFAQGNCIECHKIGPRSQKVPALVGGPDFSGIANDSETTAFSLNAFLQTPHVNMPNLMLAPRDRRNVIAYIMSLKASRSDPL